MLLSSNGVDMSVTYLSLHTMVLLELCLSSVLFGRSEKQGSNIKKRGILKIKLRVQIE